MPSISDASIIDSNTAEAKRVDSGSDGRFAAGVLLVPGDVARFDAAGADLELGDSGR